MLTLPTVIGSGADEGGCGGAARVLLCLACRAQACAAYGQNYGTSNPQIHGERRARETHVQAAYCCSTTVRLEVTPHWVKHRLHSVGYASPRPRLYSVLLLASLRPLTYP